MAKPPDYIKIKESLRPKEALNCSSYIASRPHSDRFFYDFSELGHCPAFGMLAILNAIRNNIARHPLSEHIPCLIDEGRGGSYAAHMGLFSSVEHPDWNIGREEETSKSGERVIPIKKIRREELRQEYPEKSHVLGEMIELASDELAFTLTQEKESAVNDTLRYCIREIIRNVFEHSGSDHVWICGQYWPSRNSTEIAIMDEGRGILNSLQSNRRYDVSTDIDANKLALQPGVSRMMGMKQDRNDPWQNSGYGLFMSSSICTMGGHFILSSGQDTTFINASNSNNYVSNTKGTIICLSLKTDTIDNLSTLLGELRKKGEKISRQFGKNRILTASQVSSIASIIGHTKKN